MGDNPGNERAPGGEWQPGEDVLFPEQILRIPSIMMENYDVMAAPEPPFPYGRGYNVPVPVEAYPAWAGALWPAIVAGICAPYLALGIYFVAPQVLATISQLGVGTASVCATNPKLCSQ